MVSVCLPSDALLQHLPFYLGFSYLGRGVSLHGCSSKAQPLLLTLDDIMVIITVEIIVKMIVMMMVLMTIMMLIILNKAVYLKCVRDKSSVVYSNQKQYSQMIVKCLFY